MTLTGQMMDQPLSISALIEYAEKYHGDTEIVSRRTEGDIHRYTYADAAVRSRQLASALQKNGVEPGTRLATLAWNGYRHLEIYYAVSGIGAICHTVNPRLFPEQIGWILNHAEDSHIFVDLTFLPLIEAVYASLTAKPTVVVLTDRAHMPDSSLDLVCYEELLAQGDSSGFEWPVLDEQTASSLCYTSGTTGNPKGVLYSHRSTVLHAWASCMPDVLNLSATDVILPVVPMFHVNAWGLPYAAAMVGAKLVFPGAGLDGPNLCELFSNEGVTLTAGVPTVWLAVLNYLAETGGNLGVLNRTVIGGSACPPSMIDALQDKYGVRVIHAWGMTEMSPIGTIGAPKARHVANDSFRPLQEKQGRPPYGVDMKIVDADGRDLPWDGKAYGDLWVRGPWICSGYYKPEKPDPHENGWFPTGDVATIDADGYMQIVDRSKDVVKSGGEWISSIELENIAMAHPAVAEAACIAARHEKWDERPLLIVIRKPGAVVDEAELLSHFEGKIAKWWLPDAVLFVDEIPHTATGKVQKLKLRERYGDYLITSQVTV